MSLRIIPREQVAHELSVSQNVLVRYEAMGLVRAVKDGTEIGYEPTQIRRLWTIVSFQRDLGINLAGVEVILQLNEQLSEIHHRVNDLADRLRELIEEGDSPPIRDTHD